MCVFLLLAFILHIFPGMLFVKGACMLCHGSAKGCTRVVVILFFFKVLDYIHDD